MSALSYLQQILANVITSTAFNSPTPMETARLLTIAQTAELLNCSAGFVRKRIALTESNQPGGWPKGIFVNLQPNGAKSLYRINQDALQDYLKGDVEASLEEAKVEVSTACTL
jgi:hypothetical protein